MAADRTPAGRVQALDRPPRADVGLMLIGLVAISTSAPLIRYASAPSLAIAFWRNLLGAAAVLGWAVIRHRGELRAVRARECWLSVGSGVLLAAHFATWVPSISFTSVASSVALVTAQPVWAALIARARGESVPGRAFVGIAVALAGVLVLTGVDVTISTRALLGDVLALLGGLLAAAYVTVGAEVRRTLTTTAYTAICYPTTAILLFVCALIGGRPLAGYDAGTWWILVAMTIGPHLLGHSVFNRVLRTTSPMIVSIAVLFEVVGAALMAAFPPISETPPLATVPAVALLVLGVMLVVRASERSPEVAGAPPLE